MRVAGVLRRFLASAILAGERGQALAEEVLLLALIAVVALGALAALGVDIAESLGDATAILDQMGTDEPHDRR